MNGISSRQNPIGQSATSMNGRRRPSGVWKESLQGPTIGEIVEREDALGAEDHPDQAAGVREPVQQRRQVGRGRGDRERQPEGTEPELPEQPPPDRGHGGEGL